jgi:hypothetical protein
MSSPTLQQLLAFEAEGGHIVAAVGTVAERSFFAFVDECDDPGDNGDGREWLVATVSFDDGPVSGSLVCSLPGDLALVLFDAFSGRDPVTPLPPRHEVDDLIGEFSNMVCGTLLTRATDRAFRLSPPVVDRVQRPGDVQGRRRWVSVNDRPIAIDWVVAGDEPLAAGA